MSKPPVSNLRVVITSEDMSILAAGPVFDIVESQEDNKYLYLIGVIYEGEEFYYRIDMAPNFLNSIYWNVEQGESVDAVYQHPVLGNRYFHFYCSRVV